MNNNYQNFYFSVFIRCGKNFENKKLIEWNAPYVEVTIGDEIKKTSKGANLTNPCWNETLKFKFNNDNLPTFIKFTVKDDRTLIGSAELGNYMFNLDIEKLNKYKMQPEMTPFITLYDGLFNLKNSERGLLDVKILFTCGDCNWLLKEDKQSFSSTNELMDNNNNYQSNFNNQEQKVTYEEVNRNEFNKIPDIALQKNELIEDNKQDENKYKLLDKNEVHVLPTIHVQEKPKIIEKEIEYIKPVQIKETIIHKEKPIIIEQPIVKEKYEHYRETPDYIRNNEKIVTETVHEKDVGNLDQEQLLNLRQERMQQFNDTTPIIKHEKEQIQLDTDIREKPTEIREKEVVYQQPIEIEKTNIEKIKPKVREEVLLEKEHIHQKLAPEFYSEDAQRIRQQDEFYSKEIDKNLKIIPAENTNLNANTNANLNQNQQL